MRTYLLPAGLLPAGMLCITLLLASCGDDTPEPQDAPGPSIYGVWELDFTESLQASRDNHEGDFTDEHRRESVLSFERYFAGLRSARFEMLREGLLKQTLVHKIGEPEVDNKRATVASSTETEVTLQYGTQDEKFRFLTPDRIRGTTAEGALIQIWNRVK